MQNRFTSIFNILLQRACVHVRPEQRGGRRGVGALLGHHLRRRHGRRQGARVRPQRQQVRGHLRTGTGIKLAKPKI